MPRSIRGHTGDGAVKFGLGWRSEKIVGGLTKEIPRFPKQIEDHLEVAGVEKKREGQSGEEQHQRDRFFHHRFYGHSSQPRRQSFSREHHHCRRRLRSISNAFIWQHARSTHSTKHHFRFPSSSRYHLNSGFSTKKSLTGTRNWLQYRNITRRNNSIGVCRCWCETD